MKKYIILFAVVLGVLLQFHTASAASFSLRQGWNLVNGNVVVQLFSPSSSLEQFLARGGAIFGLDPRSKHYVGGTTADDIDKNLDTMIEAMPNGEEDAFGMGFWVYTPTASTMTINFSIVGNDRDTYAAAHHYYKGWNLVGITDLMRGRSLNEIKGTCTFVAIYVFEGGEWHKAGDRGNDFDEKIDVSAIGNAFAMKVVNDCKFNFATRSTVPSVPNLPE